MQDLGLALVGLVGGAPARPVSSQWTLAFAQEHVVLVCPVAWLAAAGGADPAGAAGDTQQTLPSCPPARPLGAPWGPLQCHPCLHFLK